MRVIKANIQNVKGQLNRSFKRCVGSGRAYEGLLAEHQRHLSIVKNECDFEYIRFHGLLHDDMGVYNEDKDGNTIYNWQYVDLLYDYILSLNMKPFVELGFMPSALSSGKETVFWWKGNITPPKSYEKWAELIKELVLHFTLRYGKEEVSKWYFEVWNEPNLSGFFAGDMNEYFKLYEITSKAIKNVSADYKVGGPATAGIGWIKEFLDFCYEKGAMVDFVSTHSYGVLGYLDEFGVQQLHLDSDPEAVTKDIKTVYEQVKSSKFPDIEIHFTEWSTSYSPHDPVHDSYVSAPYILSKIKNCEGFTNSMSYWVFSDIFEEPGPQKYHFHGGFGLMNIQGLKKPSFFAYKYLNKLGDIELECNDKNSWACKDRDGVQLLFWDYTYLKQDASNQEYYKRDLPSQFKDKVQLCISGLEAGNYQMAIYSVGYRKNDVYTEFLGIEYNGTMTKEQVEMLNSKTTGLPIKQSSIQVENNKDFVYELDMHENEVYLVTLESI